MSDGQSSLINNFINSSQISAEREQSNSPRGKKTIKIKKKKYNEILIQDEQGDILPNIHQSNKKTMFEVETISSRGSSRESREVHRIKSPTDLNYLDEKLQKLKGKAQISTKLDAKGKKMALIKITKKRNEFQTAAADQANLYNILTGVRNHVSNQIVSRSRFTM